MDNVETVVQVVLTRKDVRKLFRTIVLANVVSYVGLKAIKNTLANVANED